MITVSFAITYYVVVLATEISVLGTASARSRTAAKSVRGAKLLSSGPPGAAGEFDPGIVDTQVNPHFLQVKVEAGSGSPGGAASADSKAGDVKALLASVQSLKDPPAPEVWARFQTSLGELKALVQAGEEQLVGLLAEEKAVAVEVEAEAGASSLKKDIRRRAERTEIAAVLVDKGAARRSIRSSGSGGSEGGGSPSLSMNPLLAGRGGRGGAGAEGSEEASASASRGRGLSSVRPSSLSFAAAAAASGGGGVEMTTSPLQVSRGGAGAGASPKGSPMLSALAGFNARKL
jgi:hypothetical protein